MIYSLRMQNFRSYSDESFEFEPGINIVVGPNGCGKTNMLEAVLVNAVGGSYRANDQELMKFDAEWSRIDVLAEDQQRTVKLVQTDGKPAKTYELDSKAYKILSLQNSLPVVLFEPNHLELLHGQPELRRAYLDGLLEQTVSGYKTTRRHFKRVLAQRNRLLKQDTKPSQDQLFVWNLRLSELGGVIAKQRAELVDQIQSKLEDLYNDVSGTRRTTVRAEYVSKLPIDTYESSLLKALEASLSHDLTRGFTSFGPHRDDLLITFNGRPADEVASRGETRTALLALKVHELYMLEASRGQKPLLLLDDVFSELDGKRRHALASFLKTHQTFITTTDADLVLDKNLEHSHVIALSVN